MSSGASPVINIELRRNRGQQCVLFATLAAAVVIPWLLPIGVLPAGMLMLGSGLGISAWGRAAGWIGTDHRLQRIVRDTDGQWWLFSGRDGRRPASLSAASRLMGGTLWLHWRCAGRGYPLLLLRGDVSAQEWRALVVRLRLEGPDRTSQPERATP